MAGSTVPSLAEAEGTSYFLALRPCIEIFAISPSAVQSLRGLDGRPVGSGGDVDLLTLATGAYQAARVVAQNRTSTLLLLLTTGGVLYLLFSKKDDDRDPTEGRYRSGRWRPRSDWFSWLFNGSRDEETLFEADASLVLRGRYFGPAAAPRSTPKAPRGILKPSQPQSKTVSLNEALNTRYEASFLAPCPNCERGSCRIKKHLKLRVYETKSSGSSYSNSPNHSTPSNSKESTPGPEMKPAGKSSSLPPTSTPESADDELSPDEELKHRKQQDKFGSRICSRPQYGTVISLSTGRSHKLKPKRHNSNHHPPISNATAKLYSSSRHRIPPEGRERLPGLSPLSPVPSVPSLASLQCVGEQCTDPLCLGLRQSMEKEESMDSIANVSGSMRNLVQSSREVRKMIREASFDSLASDFSLDFGSTSHGLGASTELHLERLQGDLDDVKENCGYVGNAISHMDSSQSRAAALLTSSKSEYVLAPSPSSSRPRAASESGAASRDLESSAPDLRYLELPSSSRPAQFLRMTHVESPLRGGTPANSTEPDSLEWESPMHAWHDLRLSKYKMALAGSRTASEYGDDTSSFVTNEELDGLEWDCEGFSASLPADVLTDHAGELLGHSSWLPESVNGVELDLEAELEGGSAMSSRVSSANVSRASSRRHSLDKFYWKQHVRQPPSGRSSVERGSGDTPRQAIDHETLVKSFGVRIDPVSGPSRLSCASTCSEESGFAEGCAMDSSVTTTMTNQSIVTLSPVHESREEQPSSSPNNTPLRRRTTEGQAVTLIGKRKLFSRDPEEEHISVVIHTTDAQ